MTAIPAQENNPAGKKEKRYTIEEYLEMEESSLVNHEYDNGKRIPMAGGSPLHSKIKALVVTALNNALVQNKKQWDVYNSDIRIYIPHKNRGVIPDAAVVAGEADFSIETPVGLLLNPTLVVEVLSEGNESYNRGSKFALYRTLPSFAEYVLVSQTEPRVETFVKENGKWYIHEDVSGIDAEVKLVSLGVNIALSDIYRNVNFEPKTQKQTRRGKK